MSIPTWGIEWIGAEAGVGGFENRSACDGVTFAVPDEVEEEEDEEEDDGTTHPANATNDA